MSKPANLELRNVEVTVGARVVCHDVNLRIEPGEVHVMFGPNGSGKSSLLSAIAGLPPFRVTKGEILVRGTPVNDLDVDERARLGVGMAFQRPPALSGVTVREFADALGATSRLAAAADPLDLRGFADRAVNVGFSGGEIKRWELLKLTLQRPALALFDEPESGVDLEHIAAVGAGIDRILRERSAGGFPVAGMVITHTGYILDHIAAHRGHLLIDGRIEESGDPSTLFQRIKRDGYRPSRLAGLAGVRSES